MTAIPEHKTLPERVFLAPACSEKESYALVSVASPLGKLQSLGPPPQTAPSFAELPHSVSTSAMLLSEMSFMHICGVVAVV